MTWLRGARCTDPEEMPEKEARPPAQNRHGGAPRGERVPLDARRASPGTAPSRAETRDNLILRLSALRSPLIGVDGTETSKTRARKGAAGRKKTALFDMVNRNDAATRSGPRRACEGASPTSSTARAEAQRDERHFRPHPEEAAKPPSRRGGRPPIREGSIGADSRCPSCFETPRCARLLSMRAKESSRASEARGSVTPPGYLPRGSP